jgi:hypothetical protein
LNEEGKRHHLAYPAQSAVPVSVKAKWQSEYFENVTMGIERLSVIWIEFGTDRKKVEDSS